MKERKIRGDVKYDGIICFDRSTRIYNVKGNKISGNEIKAGDNLEILIDGTVIYEPLDTFYNCYRIKVLPQETDVLKEVHVFSREDYWRKQIGTLSGEETQVIIEAANKGEWFVKNEYRDNRLKLKWLAIFCTIIRMKGLFTTQKKRK